MMIHYFNPGHETAVLNESRFYQAPANVRKMQEDLAFLPAWYAADGDGVLVDKPVPESFSTLLKKFGISVIPIAADQIGLNREKLIYTKAEFWGITPQAIHLFETISERYDLSLDIPSWDSQIKQLNSRRLSADCLSYIQSKVKEIEKMLLPVFYSSLEEIESVNQSSFKRMLLKAPFSSSGRGLLWLEEKELSRSSRQIISGILKKQSEVSLEQVVNKVLDFSMHFAGKQFLGYSLFETNAKGSYEKTWMASQERIYSRLKEYVDPETLSHAQQCLAEFIEQHILPYYIGCIGIDMMIYQSETGYHVHPCVEINPRKSMGYLAMRVYEQYVDPGSEGYFSICYNQPLREEATPVYAGKRIKEGVLDLCPVNPETKYRAIIDVKKVTR